MPRNVSQLVSEYRICNLRLSLLSNRSPCCHASHCTLAGPWMSYMPFELESLFEQSLQRPRRLVFRSLCPPWPRKGRPAESFLAGRQRTRALRLAPRDPCLVICFEALESSGRRCAVAASEHKHRVPWVRTQCESSMSLPGLMSPSPQL